MCPHRARPDFGPRRPRPAASVSCRAPTTAWPSSRAGTVTAFARPLRHPELGRPLATALATQGPAPTAFHGIPGASAHSTTHAAMRIRARVNTKRNQARATPERRRSDRFPHPRSRTSRGPEPPKGPVSALTGQSEVVNGRPHSDVKLTFETGQGFRMLAGPWFLVSHALDFGVDRKNAARGLRVRD